MTGKPVANAKVVREVLKAHTYDDYLTDETSTDEHGYFTMPAVRQKSILAKLFWMDFGVSQEIHVIHEGMKHEIWSGVKNDPAENAESRGKPLVVSCELTRERSMITVNRGTIFGKCTWDVEPDEEKPLMTPEEIEHFKKRNEEERLKRLEKDG